MEQKPSMLMTPFDCQTIPQWLYMLKLILPYTPEKFHHSLAVFIRFQEMQSTIKNFKNFNCKKQFDNILNDMKPYMDPSTQEMMEQLETMMGMMDMMSEFMPNDIMDIFNMKGDSAHERMDESSCNEKSG